MNPSDQNLAAEVDGKIIYIAPLKSPCWVLSADPNPDSFMDPQVYCCEMLPGYQLRKLPARDTTIQWELWMGQEMVARETISCAEAISVQNAQSVALARLHLKAMDHAAGK